ncbi:inositol 4-methyltransferase-like [Prosopis cineraria]|uniref:inositol 4-methyltransferase-like n=1 Tax=Prosopis cineraria TaxID=364024 RepID=UPI002410427A|nr:inositol 4-methyltransferase-like [Prosopis cineraria]
MAMQMAVELDVFDVIHKVGHDAKMSTVEIATELSCKNSKASALDRLLRLLVSHSVLTCSVMADEDRGRTLLFSKWRKVNCCSSFF